MSRPSARERFIVRKSRSYSSKVGKRTSDNNFKTYDARQLMARSGLDPAQKAFFQAVGARIKQLRLERGLTQRDMVVLHRYTDSQWRGYERGDKNLTLTTLHRIAEIFGTAISDLLEGVGPERKQATPRPTSPVLVSPAPTGSTSAKTVKVKAARKK